MRPYYCSDEEEARNRVNYIETDKNGHVILNQTHPGEKPFEEFYTSDENPDFSTFSNIGIVKPHLNIDEKLLKGFLRDLERIKNEELEKEMIVVLFESLLPNFNHIETNKNLGPKNVMIRFF